MTGFGGTETRKIQYLGPPGTRKPTWRGFQARALPRPPPPIDEHGVPGDVARLVRGEIAHGGRNVLYGAAAPRGHDRAHLLVAHGDAPRAHVGDIGPEDLLRVPAQVRQDGARAHGIDRDAAR